MPRRIPRPTLSRTLSCLAFGTFYVALLLFAAGHSAIASDAEDFFTHIHTQKMMANVTVSPGRAGPVDITIQLETVDELPLPAKAVSVTLSNRQSGIGPQTVQAVHTSDDQWQARMSLAAAGRWTLGLGISISDAEKVSVDAPILIK